MEYVMQVANLKDMGTPGAELENIMYLRNVADADKILEVVKKMQKDGGKVSVDTDNALVKSSEFTRFECINTNGTLHWARYTCTGKLSDLTTTLKRLQLPLDQASFQV